jgi:hypothetical protein
MCTQYVSRAIKIFNRIYRENTMWCVIKLYFDFILSLPETRVHFLEELQQKCTVDFHPLLLEFTPVWSRPKHMFPTDKPV